MNICHCKQLLHRGLASDLRSASHRRLSDRDVIRQCLRSISSSTASTASRPLSLSDRIPSQRSALSQQRPPAFRVALGSRDFTSSSPLHKKGKKAARSESPKEQREDQQDGAAKQAADHDPFDFTTLTEEVKQAHERLREGLAKLRAGGRFNPEVLERLRVQPDRSSNTTVPLSDVAQVIPKGRTVQLIVGEQEHVKPVTSAVQGSDLSLTPQPDPTGTNPLLLEIKIPPPTAESRQAAVKEAGKAGEKASVAIQNARAKQHKKHRAMQSVKTIRPDDLRKAGTAMEKLIENGQAEVKKIVDNAKKTLESA